MDKPKRNYSISKIPVISPRLIQLRMGFWVGFPDLEIRTEARSRGAGAGGGGGGVWGLLVFPKILFGLK